MVLKGDDEALASRARRDRRADAQRGGIECNGVKLVLGRIHGIGRH